MSFNIVNDHLFTDFEVEYLQARNQDKLVEANRKEFANTKKTEPPKFSKEVFDHVAMLNPEDLAKELEDKGLSSSGTEKDQRIRLATELDK